MNKLEKIFENTDGETRVELEEFVHSFANIIKENHELKQKIDYMAHDNRLLRKKLFGSSSEKLTPEIAIQDGLLFNEFELVSQQVESEELQLLTLPVATPDVPRKKPGRKPLPSHLPRIVINHDLSTEEKVCACGNEMECIGDQVSEELDYVSAKVEVIQHRCKKYICSCCVNKKENDESIRVTSRTAKKPAQLIGKSIASAGLLANIAVSKFCDHLPLYRQEYIFKRLSIELSRQTMSVWMLKVGVAIIPLINLMQDNILIYDVAFADETTIQVLNEANRRAQTKSYMWCFLGGAPDQRVIIYQYHPTRESEVPNQFFAGYKGGLHCDGYGGYNALLQSEDIIGINCWAHVRRKFVEALPQGKEKGVSGHVVRVIRALYQIEENLKAANADIETTKAIRLQKSKLILDDLKVYLDEKSKTVLRSSKLGIAIEYTRKRWPYLITYLLDGRYEIDNNRSERAIKPFVCGRNNWLFANSTEGAHASANLFSLIETTKLHKLDPVKYLTHVFKELPNCKTVSDYEALLPYNICDENLKISKKDGVG
jgi:transposase